MARWITIFLVAASVNLSGIVDSRAVDSRAIIIVGHWDTKPSRKNASQVKQQDQLQNSVKKQNNGGLNGVPIPHFNRDVKLSRNKYLFAKKATVNKVGPIISTKDKIITATQKRSTNSIINPKLKLKNSLKTNGRTNPYLANNQRKKEKVYKNTQNIQSSKQPFKIATFLGKKKGQPLDIIVHHMSESQAMNDPSAIDPADRRQRKKSSKTATKFSTGKLDHVVTSLDSTIAADFHKFRGNIKEDASSKKSSIQQKTDDELRSPTKHKQPKTVSEKSSQWVQFVGTSRNQNKNVVLTVHPPMTITDNNVEYAKEHSTIAKVQQQQQYAMPWSLSINPTNTNRQNKNVTTSPLTTMTTTTTSRSSQQEVNAKNYRNRKFGSMGQVKSHTGMENGNNNGRHEGNGRQDIENNGNNRHSHNFYHYPYYDWWNYDFGIDTSEGDFGF